ncbi:hypothetical protein VNI00_008797 [Paramarasmius palmivorus]|uniref:Uncharacterized protein n=1 Tax=Paramarasmius palmivorus TaxID=297713 RepID=A0AAW0CVG3_9AGAR
MFPSGKGLRGVQQSDIQSLKDLGMGNGNETICIHLMLTSHLHGQVIEISTLWHCRYKAAWLSRHGLLDTTPVQFLLQTARGESSTDRHHLSQVLRSVCLGEHPEVEVATLLVPQPESQCPAQMQGFKSFGQWEKVFNRAAPFSFETEDHALAFSFETGDCHPAVQKFLQQEDRAIHQPRQSCAHFFVAFGLVSISSVICQLKMAACDDLVQRLGQIAEIYTHSPGFFQQPHSDYLITLAEALAFPNNPTDESLGASLLEVPSVVPFQDVPGVNSASPSTFLHSIYDETSVASEDQSKLLSELRLFEDDEDLIVLDSDVQQLQTDLYSDETMKIPVGPWVIRTEETVRDAMAVIGGGHKALRSAEYKAEDGDVADVYRYYAALSLLSKAGAEFDTEGWPLVDRGLLISLDRHSYASILENLLGWSKEAWIQRCRVYGWAQSLTTLYSWQDYNHREFT